LLATSAQIAIALAMSETLFRLRDSPDDDSSSHILEADRFGVQFYSSCAQGLPAAAEEWDLSQLLVEGQPVQHSTVVCWLHALTQHSNHEPLFGEQPDSPPLAMRNLTQLLAFADAVGSITGLMRAVDAQVSAAATLVAEVQLGEQQLQLAVDKCYYFPDITPLQLWCIAAGKQQKLATISSAADKEGMRQQFVPQLEALLYLAYKLQLPQLQRVLHSCIANNSGFSTSLFSSVDDMRPVMSARVVDAAAGCGAAQDALIASSSNELCGFGIGAYWRQLFTPLNLKTAQQAPLTFKAEVREDVFSLKKGQIVRIELDLFNTALVRVAVDEPGAVPFSCGVDLMLGRQLQLRS
jgi:hypothetical protein